jgi:hypothetical protein
MDGPLQLLPVLVAATIPAALIHELGRAAAALALTEGRVCVLLGSGRTVRTVRIGRLMIGANKTWLWGGECLHAPAASKRRATAILLTGPLAGNLAFVAAIALAVTWNGGPTDHAALQLGLFVFALVAFTRATMDMIRAR